jgi:hypothetical protein
VAANDGRESWGGGGGRARISGVPSAAGFARAHGSFSKKGERFLIAIA